LIRIKRVGKQKISPEIENYLKKINNIQIITIKEDQNSNSETRKTKEGEKLSNKNVGFIVALSEEGIEMDSVSFALLIKTNPDITFLIGGAFGLSNIVKQKANKILSLSKMTLSHELALLILVEQIYRAERINEGHPYHKM
jgi:23S rRNA (pseudouridine1915-N3)-methyltransferase